MSSRAPKIEFYQDRKDLWRWRAIAANGRILADSAEGYVRLADCERGAGITAQAILARNLVPTSHAIH